MEFTEETSQADGTLKKCLVILYLTNWFIFATYLEVRNVNSDMLETESSEDANGSTTPPVSTEFFAPGKYIQRFREVSDRQ